MKKITVTKALFNPTLLVTPGEKPVTDLSLQEPSSLEVHIALLINGSDPGKNSCLNNFPLSLKAVYPLPLLAL